VLRFVDVPLESLGMPINAPLLFKECITECERPLRGFCPRHAQDLTTYFRAGFSDGSATVLAVWEILHGVLLLRKNDKNEIRRLGNDATMSIGGHRILGRDDMFDTKELDELCDTTRLPLCW
jgi:hypothetical protein